MLCIEKSGEMWYCQWSGIHVSVTDSVKLLYVHRFTENILFPGYKYKKRKT